LAFILTLDAAPITFTIDPGTKLRCFFWASFHIRKPSCIC